jgi:hypothetical protein
MHGHQQVHPASRACVIIPGATYGLGAGGRISFWDTAVGWYLEGNFQDFPTSFIHVDDLARCACLASGRAGCLRVGASPAALLG